MQMFKLGRVVNFLFYQLSIQKGEMGQYISPGTNQWFIDMSIYVASWSIVCLSLPGAKCAL